jgi:hypothetical protein
MGTGCLQAMGTQLALCHLMLLLLLLQPGTSRTPGSSKAAAPASMISRRFTLSALAATFRCCLDTLAQVVDLLDSSILFCSRQFQAPKANIRLEGELA